MQLRHLHMNRLGKVRRVLENINWCRGFEYQGNKPHGVVLPDGCTLAGKGATVGKDCPTEVHRNNSFSSQTTNWTILGPENSSKPLKVVVAISMPSISNVKRNA